MWCTPLPQKCQCQDISILEKTTSHLMSVIWSKVVVGTRMHNKFRSEMYECFNSENSYMSRLRQDCRTDFKWAHLSGSYSTFTLLLRLGSHLIHLITRPQSQSLLMLSGFSRWYCMKFTQPSQDTQTPRPSHHSLCPSPLAIQVMIWFDILSIHHTHAHVFTPLYEILWLSLIFLAKIEWKILRI